MNNIDKDFDNRIRSLMQDAQEEVPGFVWDNVQNVLDSVPAAKPQRPFFRLVRILAPVAAAAAIAVGIFFAVFDPSSQPQAPVLADASADNEILADEKVIVGQKAVAENIDAVDVAPSAGDRTSAGMDDLSGISVLAETVIAYVEEPSSADASESEDDSENLAAQLEERSEQVRNDEADPNVRILLADLVEGEPDVQEMKRTKVLFTVSGNTSSGPDDNVVNVRPLRVISNATPKESTVTETGLSDYGMPVSIGFGAKFIFTPRWSLGVSLNYTSMGREFAGTYTNVNDGKIVFKEAFKDIRNTQGYIGINANAYFSIISRSWLDFYAYLGGGADHCISNVYQMFGESSRYTHKDKLGSLQFSARAGLGVEFLVTDYLGVYIDPSVSYHFKNKGTLKNIRAKYPLLPSLEIGVRFRL